MLNQHFYKVDGIVSFGYKNVIFMAVIMKSYSIFFLFISINPGESDYRPSKVAANVFGNSFGIGKVWFCIYVKTIFLIFVGQTFIFLN